MTLTPQPLLVPRYLYSP